MFVITPRCSSFCLVEFGENMQLTISPLALFGEWTAHTCPILTGTKLQHNYLYLYSIFLLIL